MHVSGKALQSSYTYIHIHIYLHVHIYIYIFIYISCNVWCDACVGQRVAIFIYIYSYTYISSRTYIHIHIHIYMLHSVVRCMCRATWRLQLDAPQNTFMYFECQIQYTWQKTYCGRKCFFEDRFFLCIYAHMYM